MTAIKQDILRRWDTFPYPVKLCCIKFVQRVVQVQTHGLISDPRVRAGEPWICVEQLTDSHFPSGRTKTKPLLPSFLEIMRSCLCPIWRLRPLVCWTVFWLCFRRSRGNTGASTGLIRNMLLILWSSDPLLVNATLNSLSVLIRTRQSVGNKIINAILNFFPSKQARSPITPTVRVGVKSMERTARALMINILKR